jgi:hypothetical protein
MISMYRVKIYADNPSQQVTLGFDDNLHSFFAKVIHLDNHDILLDRGHQRHELTTPQDLLGIITPFCQSLPPSILQALERAVLS